MIWYSDRHSVDESDLKQEARPDIGRLCPVARDCVMLYEHDYMYGRRWIVAPEGKALLFRDRPNYDQRRPGPGW